MTTYRINLIRGEEQHIPDSDDLFNFTVGNPFIKPNDRSRVTEPYIVNDEFPEKEKTVPHLTDWFDPFTVTPWANRKPIYADTVDYKNNKTEEDIDQSNSKAISGSVSVSRTSVIIHTFSLYVILFVL